MVAIVTAGGVADRYARHRIEDFPAISAGETAPFSVSPDADPRHTFPPRTYSQLRSEYAAQPNEGPIEIPLSVTGIAPNHAVRIDAETFIVSGDGHPDITIPWESQAGGLRFTDSPQFGESGPLLGNSQWTARIPRWLYREFADRKITLRITYAVTEFEAEPSVSVPFDGHSADVPEQGHCFDAPSYPAKETGMVCQYALTGPSLTHVTWNLQENCNPISGSVAARQEWIGSSDRGWREFAVSPVIGVNAVFATKATDSDDPRTYRLCNASPFTFTKYHIWRRRMIEVTLPPIDPTIYIPPPIHQPDSDVIPPPDSE
jgi:hypothetical protein